MTASPGQPVSGTPASPPASLSGPQQQMVRALRYGSLAILGGYALATCYKAGLVARLLPARLNRRLEAVVEAVKNHTRPMGDAKRFAMARAHLTTTYGLATAGMLALAAGVAQFHYMPYIPIAFPVATTLVPAMLLLGIPKELMLPVARTLCFAVSLMSAGYAMGPVVWVARDTLLVFVLMTGCTMTGLCVPLYLTRGMISYVVSAQVLSSALSVALVTAPHECISGSPFNALKRQEAVQIILNGDINVLFTMQLLSNVGICVLHTLPTVFHMVRFSGSEAELRGSVDPVKEAFCICAGTTYVIYRTVRWACQHIIRRVMTDNARRPQGGQGQNTWLALSNHSLDVNRASGVVSGLVMGLWYVRAISLLQRGDMATTLDQVRHVCGRVSPMTLLLGRSAMR